jgi:hypothetical protein
MKDAAKDTRQTASAELIPKIDATLEEHRYETAKRDFETASCVQPQIRRQDFDARASPPAFRSTCF